MPYNNFPQRALLFLFIIEFTSFTYALFICAINSYKQYISTCDNGPKNRPHIHSDCCDHDNYILYYTPYTLYECAQAKVRFKKSYTDKCSVFQEIRLKPLLSVCFCVWNFFSAHSCISAFICVCVNEKMILKGQARYSYIFRQNRREKETDIEIKDQGKVYLTLSYLIEPKFCLPMNTNRVRSAYPISHRINYILKCIILCVQEYLNTIERRFCLHYIDTFTFINY